MCSHTFREGFQGYHLVVHLVSPLFAFLTRLFLFFQLLPVKNFQWKVRLCRSPSQLEIAAVASLPALQQLSFQQCGLLDQDILTLARLAPTLEHLVLHECK